jgi:hypothetical protein
LRLNRRWKWRQWRSVQSIIGATLKRRFTLSGVLDDESGNVCREAVLGMLYN